MQHENVNITVEMKTESNATEKIENIRLRGSVTGTGLGPEQEGSKQSSLLHLLN